MFQGHHQALLHLWQQGLADAVFLQELKCLQMWSREQGWSWRWDLCDGFFLEAGKQNPSTRAALNDCRVSCEKQCFFWTLSCLMKQNRGEAFQILFFKSSAGSSYNKSFSTPVSTRILLFILPSLGTDQIFNKAEEYMLLKVNDKMLYFRYILKVLPKGEFFLICHNLLITSLQIPGKEEGKVVIFCLDH